MTENAKKMLRLALPIMGSLLLLQPVAQADTYTLKLLSVPSWTMGGVYTSPYRVLVTGENGSSEMLLVCDDLAADMNIGDTWTANRWTLEEVDNGDPHDQKFPTTPYGSGIPVVFPDNLATTHYKRASEAYLAAAFLTRELLFAGLNQFDSGIYSFAVWQIFYQNAYLGYEGLHPLTTAEADQVAATMNWAFTEATATGARANLGYDVDIYTPCGLKGCQDPPNVRAAQEFIGLHVPEASATAILVFDLSVLFGGLFLVRRRMLWKAGVPS